MVRTDVPSSAVITGKVAYVDVQHGVTIIVFEANGDAVMLPSSLLPNLHAGENVSLLIERTDFFEAHK